MVQAVSRELKFNGLFTREKHPVKQQEGYQNLVSTPLTTKVPPEKTAPKKRGLLWKLKMALYAGAIAISYAGIQYPLAFINNHYQGERMVFSTNTSFKYFVPDGQGGYKEKMINFDLMRVKHQIAERMMEVLQDRPDLQQALRNIPGGLEIRLYQSDELLHRKEPNGKVLGEAEIKDGKVAMEFATKEVDHEMQLNDPNNDVVAHELTHILDYIDALKDGQVHVIGADGFLPGWDDSDKQAFTQAREAEKVKIASKQSPMDEYALTNNAEFTAVLSETFFEKPASLRAANPILYNLMRKAFGNIDPAAGPVWSAIKQTARGDFRLDYIPKRDRNPALIMFGSFVVLLAGTTIVIGRKRKKASA